MATRKTLCFTGMDAADEASLKDLFNRASAQLGQQWSLAPEADADVLVVDVDSIYGHMTWLKVHNSARAIVALSSSPKAEADHVLTRPVDVARLVSLLSRLQDASTLPAGNAPHAPPSGEAAGGGGGGSTTTTAAPAATPSGRPPAAPASAPAAPPGAAPQVAQAPAAVAAVTAAPAAALEPAQPPVPAPAPAATPPPARDPLLADYLERGALPGPVRIEFAGSPPLVLDPAQQQYVAGTALKPLIPYCRRVVRPEDLDAITPAELEKARAAQPGQPYSRLLWLFALVHGEGQLAEGYDVNTKFRLVKWPQIEREYPKHFRIATVMMKQPASLTEIAEQSGAPLAEVVDFVNAYLATGFAETEEPPAPVEAGQQSRAGFLGRLRGRTG